SVGKAFAVLRQHGLAKIPQQRTRRGGDHARSSVSAGPVSEYSHPPGVLIQDCPGEPGPVEAIARSRERKKGWKSNTAGELACGAEERNVPSLEMTGRPGTALFRLRADAMTAARTSTQEGTFMRRVLVPRCGRLLLGIA